MNYSVTWDEAAFERMALIVNNHPDHKDFLATALQALSTALRTEPGISGESRAGNDRIIFFRPLVVIFRVWHADRRVQILDVHLSTLLL